MEEATSIRGNMKKQMEEGCHNLTIIHYLSVCLSIRPSVCIDLNFIQNAHKINKHLKLTTITQHQYTCEFGSLLLWAERNAMDMKYSSQER